MRKFVFLIAGAGALAGPRETWAILKDPQPTSTEAAPPIPGATINLPRRPTAAPVKPAGGPKIEKADKPEPPKALPRHASVPPREPEGDPARRPHEAPAPRPKPAEGAPAPAAAPSLIHSMSM